MPTIFGKADEVDIEIEQNVVFDPINTIRDSDGNLIDITGYMFRFEIKSAFDCYEQTHFVGTTEDGTIILTDPVNGEFQILIPSAVTNDFTFSSGVQQLWVIPPLQDQEKIWYGKLRIIPA